MQLKSILAFIIISFAYFSAFSQNTNEPGTLTPDTSKSKSKNKNTNNIAPGKGSGGGGIQKMEELELEEEAPNLSEPVPGAEILIEQSSEEIPNQNPKPVKEATEDKNKINKNKKPKNK